VSEHTAHSDFQEGVASFTERRSPEFAPYSHHVGVPRGWYR